MLDLKKFKEALQKRDEERYAKLKAEIIKLRDNIEKCLEMFLESSTNQARINYTGLEI